MLTVACTIRQGSRGIGLSDKLSLNATSGSGQAQVLERSDGVHLLGCLSLQSMLAGLPEQAGIKFETPQNMQTAGLDRSQLVVQRQGDFIAVLHATTVQAVIHCHCAGDLDMPAASHHSKAQHSPATTPQQSLVNHSTAQHHDTQRSTKEARHHISTACAQPMVARQAQACQASLLADRPAGKADQATLLVKDQPQRQFPLPSHTKPKPGPR